jgi:hypothetical protein
MYMREMSISTVNSNAIQTNTNTIININKHRNISSHKDNKTSNH